MAGAGTVAADAAIGDLSARIGICDGGMNAHLPASVNRDRFLTAVAVGAGTGAVGAGAGAGEVSDA